MKKLFLGLIVLSLTSCALSALFGEISSSALQGVWISQNSVYYDYYGNRTDSYLYFSFRPTSTADENGDFSGEYQIREYRRNFDSWTGWESSSDYRLIESGHFYVDYWSNDIELSSNYTFYGISKSRNMSFNFNSSTRLTLRDNFLYGGRTFYLYKTHDY